MSSLRLSDLSRARQSLIRLCQSVVYGQLLGINIEHGNPVLDPLPTALIDLKLDTADDPRPELGLTDFELREEIVRLMARLDELQNVRIERIEVRAGIPRRVIFEFPFTEPPR
jgi:hypothetical protein